MRIRFLAVPLALLLALPVAASPGLIKKDKKTLHDAVLVLDALTSAPDKGIPEELLAKAECILIFPSVAKGAFLVGGKGGRGVASCRQPDGKMGSAAFYVVAGASIGFQIGGQSADVVMLIMNPKGIDHLLADRFTIGGEATASAGPVGRTAQASTDAQMRAQILSWSWSRGLFEGAALDGSVVRPNQDANARLYGEETSGREILVDSKLAVPASAQPFVDSIRMHMEKGGRFWFQDVNLESRSHASVLVRPRAAALGLEIVSAGIRDVILPGEMKTILNRVTEARKAAEANLVTRREETAAALAGEHGPHLRVHCRG